MRTFAARRTVFWIILVITAALVLLANAALRVAMYHVAFVSGWFLFGLCVFLAIYNIRKKLTFLPLGTSASWLQLHIYVGLLTFVVFAVHIDFRLPNGPFELALALLYLTVFLSGVIGLVLSRIIPPRLATRGEEVIFDRVPTFIRRLREEVEELVLQCISESETSAVPDFYIRRLKSFFDKPRHYWAHLCHSTRPLHALVVDIEAQHRYLNDKERTLVDQITAHVKTKDDLDYHHAMQKTLKYWLFIHIPLTYTLLIVAVFHIVLVYSFAGGS